MIRNSLSPLANKIGEVLTRHGHKLATAESCTGGWVAQTITERSGSSNWFERGFVTYSNESKEEMLGVNRATIEVYGSVSRECVIQMVQGAINKSHAQCAVAITGIAGPGGGSSEKPVGTIWFGWLLVGNDYRTLRCQFAGDREAVRRQAVEQALRGILDVYA